MEKRILTAVALLACLVILNIWTQSLPVAVQKSLSQQPASQILQAKTDFGKMPVSFISNRGQLDERVDFYIPAQDKTIYFSAAGVTFALLGPNGKSSLWAVKLDFLGADSGVKPMGEEATQTLTSYFKGQPEDWKTGLRSFSRIVYSNLWPGIDLIYTGRQDRLKYQFVVHPGADPSQIRLAYRGVSSVRQNDQGGLVVTTPAGGFEDGAPSAFQEHAGQHVNVPLAYKIEDGSSEPSNPASPGKRGEKVVRYGFSVGEYDPTESLILDPVILTYCGYIGGSGSDYGYAIAADSTGCAYISGSTYSTSATFPVAAGPDPSFNGGNCDAFVAKINSEGTALDYCGFIGGSGSDFSYGIAVDTFGCAYITGYTNSTQSTFPVTVGPGLTNNGYYDVFVAKVNADGTDLDYCGYIGGSGRDYGRGVAVDASGCAYVTGYTNSTNGAFATSGGPDSSFKGGSADAFVAKVNAAGTALDYCGYIGGAGADFAFGIAVDISGSAYVTGSTTSTESTFPVSVGPVLTHKGLSDAFAAKVSVDGSTLDYCGYIGGSSIDVGYGIAVDSEGCAYITGYTASSEATFPIVTGPDLKHNAGYYDAFVAKLTSTGAGITYCGYIGGSGYDSGTGIAVDARGYAYVTGYTSSTEESFPVTVGPNLTHSVGFDAYVAKVDANGKILLFCGYIGGSLADMAMGIAVDPEGSGNIYVTGNTYSTASTFPVAVGPSLVLRGGRDAFAAKISETSIVMTAPDGGETWHVGFTENITWVTTGKVGNIKIELSTDNGETWTTVADSTENDGSYPWLIPDAVSEKCLVKISDAETGDPSDTNNAVFTITNEPTIIVKSPNGGEQWQVGSVHEITWVTGGDVPALTIELSTDATSTWTTIVDWTENDGTYTWTVPDSVSDLCLIRVSLVDVGDPADTSDAVFSIVAASTPAARVRTRLGLLRRFFNPFF